jgi:hypothetical protein
MVASRRRSCPPSDRSQYDAWQASNSIAAQRPNDQFRVPGARSRSHPGAGVSIIGDTTPSPHTDSSHLHCNAGEKPRSRQHIPGAPCIGFNGRPPGLWLPSGGLIDCTHIVYIDMFCFLHDGDQPRDDLDTTAFARATSGRSKGRASPHALLRCAR